MGWKLPPLLSTATALLLLYPKLRVVGVLPITLRQHLIFADGGNWRAFHKATFFDESSRMCWRFTNFYRQSYLLPLVKQRCQLARQQYSKPDGQLHCQEYSTPWRRPEFLCFPLNHSGGITSTVIGYTNLTKILLLLLFIQMLSRLRQQASSGITAAAIQVHWYRFKYLDRLRLDLQWFVFRRN